MFFIIIIYFLRLKEEYLISLWPPRPHLHPQAQRTSLESLSIWNLSLENLSLRSLSSQTFSLSLL